MPSRLRIQPRSLRRTARRYNPALAVIRHRASPISVLWFRLSRVSRSSTSTARPPGRNRTYEVSSRNDRRHRVLPLAARQDPLIRAVGVHDEDLAKRLEGVVVQRRFVLETVASARPED